MPDGTTISVVVITYRRPVELGICLDHLDRQTSPAAQILVVDASEGLESESVAERYHGVHYVRNPGGRGNMTNSRNRALALVTGDVVAFLDDDAYARPDYLEHLAAAYHGDATMMLGCGRTLNDQPGEDALGIDLIGKFTDRAEILGHFAAQPGRDVVIDHGIGATMSFRRECLADLGGFREWFRGLSGVCEDTDAFLRARLLGHKAVFVHDAVARHVGAPQARGRRFDARYRVAAGRNLGVLLVANYGLRDPVVRNRATAGLHEAVNALRARRSRRVAGRLLSLLGLLLGLGRGFRYCRGWGPERPKREDALAAALRIHLSG
jgi:GT2 family glycosyltransferase